MHQGQKNYSWFEGKEAHNIKSEINQKALVW
jgi:hypothetical protein